MHSNPATFGNPLTLRDAVDAPSQSKELHVNHSTPTTSDPSEGSTTAVVAVMRGTPKDGYTRQHSNKHCKQKIVQALLDSGSNSNLIFMHKEKLMLLPYSKGWFHSCGIL